MVISLRQIANRCLGLQGNFSIVRDLLGYGSNRVPGFTSLSQELILLRDREHVTVHLKIVSIASWTFTSAVPIDQMIFSMRLVFRNSNLAVIIRSTENLTLTDTDIDVGNCATGTTNDQNTLFNNRNFVGPNEIVIYFVRTVFDTMGTINGCATFPAGRPGATVASMGTTWTLVHEIGHVLANPHIEDESLGFCPRLSNPAQCMLNNIMTCCGTGRIPANTTPTFNNNQTQRIINSNLTFPCPP
jgi:hypothetical protein